MWTLTFFHYSDVMISATASQITGIPIVCPTVCSGADQRKHHSSALLAFVRDAPATGGFPSQRASNAENVSIWWRHHDFTRDAADDQAPNGTRTLPSAAVFFINIFSKYFASVITKVISQENFKYITNNYSIVFKRCLIIAQCVFSIFIWIKYIREILSFYFWFFHCFDWWFN